MFELFSKKATIASDIEAAQERLPHWIRFIGQELAKLSRMENADGMMEQPVAVAPAVPLGTNHFNMVEE